VEDQAGDVPFCWRRAEEWDIEDVAFPVERLADATIDLDAFCQARRRPLSTVID
jgi:hypothetical protein